MMNRTVLQTFAIDKCGGLAHVNNVLNGLACGCVCQACGSPLVARQGTLRHWHFAHAAEGACAARGESALHRAAKQALMQAMGMALPDATTTRQFAEGDGSVMEVTEVERWGWLDADEVTAERSLAEIRPDLIVCSGTLKLIVEIAVTHPVDDEKAARLRALGLPALEIRLSDLHQHPWTWTDLEQQVVHGTHLKHWIVPPAGDPPFGVAWAMEQVLPQLGLWGEPAASSKRSVWG